MTATLSDRDLLARLIAFDSTSRNSNLPIAEFICDYLRHPGVDVVRNANAAGDKVNLVIRVRGGDAPSGGRGSRRASDGEGSSPPNEPLPDGRGSASTEEGLILSGHMDVVPAGEPEWRNDPFTLTETEDAYVARGAADMKGFLALAINLAREAAARRLQHPLVLLLTFDEELGLLGAQHFAATWQGEIPLPRNAIIGEPTELRVVRLHKGHLKMRVTLRGVGAHSAYPHLGRNAIEPAGRVVAALSELRRALEGERHEYSAHFPQAPFVTLNVAMISGGAAVNIIPDRCVIDLGVRVLPGMVTRAVIERIRGTVEALDGLGDCAVEVVNDGPPLTAPADSAIHARLCELVGQSGSRAVSFASDAGVLQRMGIDCVLFGPGSIEVAHKPNESLPKGQFSEARGVLERVIDRFCAE